MFKINIVNNNKRTNKQKQQQNYNCFYKNVKNYYWGEPERDKYKFTKIAEFQNKKIHYFVELALYTISIPQNVF